MPNCLDDPKSYFKGTEPSPKGLGYCAHMYPVGYSSVGRDNKIWEIREDKVGRKSWKKVKS